MPGKVSVHTVVMYSDIMTLANSECLQLLETLVSNSPLIAHNVAVDFPAPASQFLFV